MKRILCIAVFVLSLAELLHAQFPVQPFKAFDSKGKGFSVIGELGKDKHPMQKELGEFYIDDAKKITELSRTWNFPLKDRGSQCGEHYVISLLRDGEELDTFSISLDCDSIQIGRSIGSFHPSFLKKLAPNSKRFVKRTDRFKTITEAREFWNRSHQDQNFLFAELRPLWVDYEGKFQIRVRCPEGDQKCYEYGRDGQALAEVRTKITRSHPREQFDLLPSGFDPKAGEVFVDLYCDRSLESKFDLYPRVSLDARSGWQPFFLGMNSYRKK